MTTSAQENNFEDFGIEAPKAGLVGDKISIEKLFNKKIRVHRFKIEDSKIMKGTKCLYLQVSKGEEMYVVFTGSQILLEQIIKVSPNKFPFNATIIKREDDSYAFTSGKTA